MVWNRAVAGLLRPSAFFAVLLLAGCGQTTGLSGIANLSLLGGTEDAAETAAAETPAEPAALAAGETPPVPTRRPGKRPSARALAAKEPASTSAVAQGPEPAKSEDSGLSLAALGNLQLFSPSSGGPDAVTIDQPPLAAYSVLAQRIKYCWLNPSAPRLPNHGFFSEIPAGEVKEAKMVVYEKDKDGRRGTTVFKVDITAEADGALVSAQNARLDKAMEAGFKADLARWAKGDERCKT